MKRAFAASVAFFCGCGIVVGAFVAYSLLPAPQGDLAPFVSESTYPVTLVDHADERVLPLVPVLADGVVLRTAGAGVVTASACRAGATFPNGSVALTLDTRPVLAVAADEPFFRDLARGDRGSDVDGLRRSLLSLGYELAESGTFDAPLAAALKDLQTKTNAFSTDGRLRLSEIMWLPSGDHPVATCDVKVGEVYAGGETLATTAASLSTLTLMQDPVDATVEGERRVRVLDVEVTLPVNGVINDPATISQIAASPRFDEEVMTTAPGSPVSGSSALTTPLRVAALPPASVFGIDGDRGCVASASTVIPVTVVGANMGMSLVLFDGEAPASVLIRPGTESCSAR